MPRIDQFRFYANALKTHGPTARGVAWRDTRRQRLRFKALLDAVEDLTLSHIVDAGCGVGDLWRYMQETGRLPARYTGLDSHPEMVRLAREHTKESILRRDLLSDPLIEADWYLLSGTLNLLTRFETLLVLKRCADAAREGVVFNLLKGREREGTYNYWMPKEILKICRPLGKVTLFEGYLEDDFTVCVRF